MGSETAMNPPLPQAAVDLLYLCGRALAGESAELERVQRMDLGWVHALAESLSLASLAFHGVESALGGAKPESAFFDAWRAQRDSAIRKHMLFAAERAHICTWLAENGIWHAPLKGAVLVDWYPRVGMREFCDNDILYDASRRDDVVSFFKERGYHAELVANPAAIHDAFTKKPVYHFEMHKRLFSEFSSVSSIEFARYYEDVRTRLVSANGSPYRLRFTDEDFYVYLLAHAYKHFCLAGTSARILCDLKVLAAHVGDDFDWAYVIRELEALGMGDFGQSLKCLVACVFERDFDPAQLRNEDLRTLIALVSYGTYGTIDHQVELGIEREEKRGTSTGGYLRKRILPDDDWWGINFPFAYRHTWSRPFFLVFRAVRAVFSPQRRQRIAAELKVLKRKFKKGAR